MSFLLGLILGVLLIITILSTIIWLYMKINGVLFDHAYVHLLLRVLCINAGPGLPAPKVNFIQRALYIFGIKLYFFIYIGIEHYLRIKFKNLNASVDWSRHINTHSNNKVMADSNNNSPTQQIDGDDDNTNNQVVFQQQQAALSTNNSGVEQECNTTQSELQIPNRIEGINRKTRKMIYLRHAQSTQNIAKRIREKSSPLGYIWWRIQEFWYELQHIFNSRTMFLDPPLSASGQQQCRATRDFLQLHSSGVPPPASLVSKTQRDPSQRPPLSPSSLLFAPSPFEKQTQEDLGYDHTSPLTTNKQKILNIINNETDVLLTTSSHRRTMSTLGLMLQHRLEKFPNEKVIVDSNLGNSFLPSLPGEVAGLVDDDCGFIGKQFPCDNLFDGRGNLGPLPQSTRGLPSIYYFVESVMAPQSTPKNIIISGHSSWLMYLLRSIGPVGHPATTSKLTNVSILSCDFVSVDIKYSEFLHIYSLYGIDKPEKIDILPRFFYHPQTNVTYTTSDEVIYSSNNNNNNATTTTTYQHISPDIPKNPQQDAELFQILLESYVTITMIEPDSIDIVWGGFQKKHFPISKYKVHFQSLVSSSSPSSKDIASSHVTTSSSQLEDCKNEDVKNASIPTLPNASSNC